MDWVGWLSVILAGYFVGSIPAGYLAGRWRGIDIREAGSGNIGATNVFRTLGPGIGVGVFLVDGIKGWLPCFLAPWLADQVNPGSSMAQEAWGVAAGVAAILGHNYTCWLRFMGGKGVATTAGVLLAWTPVAFFSCLGVWALIFAVSRYVSLASIVASIFLPVAVVFSSPEENRFGRVFWICLILGAMAVFKHRSNIRRLLDGTEYRLSRKPKGKDLPEEKKRQQADNAIQNTQEVSE